MVVGFALLVGSLATATARQSTANTFIQSPAGHAVPDQSLWPMSQPRKPATQGAHVRVRDQAFADDRCSLPGRVHSTCVQPCDARGASVMPVPSPDLLTDTSRQSKYRQRKLGWSENKGQNHLAPMWPCHPLCFTLHGWMPCELDRDSDYLVSSERRPPGAMPWPSVSPGRQCEACASGPRSENRAKQGK